MNSRQIIGTIIFLFWLATLAFSDQSVLVPSPAAPARPTTPVQPAIERGDPHSNAMAVAMQFKQNSIGLTTHGSKSMFIAFCYKQYNWDALDLLSNNFRPVVLDLDEAFDREILATPSKELEQRWMALRELVRLHSGKVVTASGTVIFCTVDGYFVGVGNTTMAEELHTAGPKSEPIPRPKPEPERRPPYCPPTGWNPSPYYRPY